MRRRTSVSGDLASKNCRTARRSSSCSSEKAKFTMLLSCSAGLAWESQHALAIEAHHLQPRVAVGQLVAQHGVVRDAPLARLVEQLRQLVLERELLREEGRAPLEAERRHRDLPSLADRAEHVLPGGARA